MPIKVHAETVVFDRQEFHTLTRQVLGLVFKVHNEFGRFLDEDLATQEIAARCGATGIQPVEREVRIQVTHGEFTKNYYMDLLLARGLLVEAKACDTTMPVHQTQALNYLLLTGMQHGLLINLRPNKVEHKFVSTKLTLEKRRQISVEASQWKEVGERCAFFRQRVLALLQDWGAFLEVPLYRDALTFFLGGAPEVQKPVEIFSGSRRLGTRALNLLSPKVAFALSAISDSPEDFGAHLLRFLRHTHLGHLQWVNFNHQVVEFRTLSNSL